MKKIFLLLIAVAPALIPFGGCKKSVDPVDHHDSTGVSNCRIAKIMRVSDYDNSLQTGIVYYNDHGDPDSVIFDFEGSSAGPALFFFSYDDHYRLIEYRADYSRDPGDYYFKHTYVYENDLVVTDTSRGRIAGQATSVLHLEYDSHGRVVRESGRVIELDHQPWEEEISPITYSYDAAGNLDGDTYVYDTKVNFHRTHKVWMFTQRNYSVNNLAGASAYNEYGYPTAFKEANRPYFLVYGISSLEYECSK